MVFFVVWGSLIFFCSEVYWVPSEMVSCSAVGGLRPGRSSGGEDLVYSWNG
uniref:ATP synthase F0 subunit 8 n=1 Tax=Patelloida saccharinoides TaxID=225156 RepID=UPI0023D7FC93|nr:ATP synthase F0 subunit 8 [Patelloida saccharinoides]WCR50870.1 ATP synthase F0 subunit 8 [Patelloida saccharinoides]